ncbi:MAG: hypothetical protein ACK5G7_02230 [Erysipelotrichaceae bacterium]
MQPAIYNKDNLIIFNYSKKYFNSHQQLVKSSEFKSFIAKYFQDLLGRHDDYYHYLYKDSPEKTVEEFISLIRLFLIYDLQEINHRLLEDKSLFDSIIEDIYNYLRKFQRFSLLYSYTSIMTEGLGFIEMDTKFNNLVISLYRLIQEKLKGEKNNVYRQLHSGTNAMLVLKNYKSFLPTLYSDLWRIPFINSLMLRTPLILTSKNNKRVGSIDEIFQNPIINFKFKEDEWLCYPAKVGKSLAYIYFHKDFLASAVGLSNLFTLASEEDCKCKPDLILLFGNDDNQNQCVFYEDKINDVIIGSVSYHQRMDYFGYMKKMTLTIHNLKTINQNQLPIHGSMINITLKNGKKKTVAFIGDSGAGKSESIEALGSIGSDDIANMDIIYDDMGTMYIKDGRVVSIGSEIGAFLRLDDLDKSSAYKDIDRSIFFNAHMANARVISPVNSYTGITQEYNVDMVFYANNYADNVGISQFKDFSSAREAFIEGKRMALGTTDESGITKTYFANPFGPMQRIDKCDMLFDQVFKTLFANGVYVGEIYSHLGLSADKDKLNIAALELLKLLES